MFNKRKVVEIMSRSSIKYLSDWDFEATHLTTNMILSLKKGLDFDSMQNVLLFFRVKSFEQE